MPVMRVELIILVVYFGVTWLVWAAHVAQVDSGGALTPPVDASVNVVVPQDESWNQTYIPAQAK